MTDQTTFLDALVEAIQQASVYNKDDQVSPDVVLWPDQDRQWEAILPQLRKRVTLLTFDAAHYAPEERRGPAYWLRCMIARTLPNDRLPEDETPVIYMPGVGRSDLRAIDECPKQLQPLAELQYRGALWTQRNGRDWTIASYLQSKDGGLGIQVGADNATKEALLAALPKLAHEPVLRLRKAAPLRAPFFHEILNPDPVRRLLLWLSNPSDCSDQITPAEWESFCSLCQQRYGFHPDKDGPVTGAQMLVDQEGVWPLVWQRFLEAPHAYPGLPVLLEQAQPKQLVMFEEPSPYWPQDTNTAEAQLREAMLGLRDMVPGEARAAISELEQVHGNRREWVWAQLDQAPLAMALEHLAALAQITKRMLGGNTVSEAVRAYVEWGWQADDAVLRALASVNRAGDVRAVRAAILPLYRPWLKASALEWQKLAEQDPSEAMVNRDPIVGESGTCIVFSDALRFDVGQRLQSSLEQQEYECRITWRLAALPTLTATAKPAIAPVAAQLTGAEPGLEPVVRDSGTGASASVLRKLLQEAGYEVLKQDQMGDPLGRAWTEIGAIDQYGHQHGWKIARHVIHELQALTERVGALLEHGWSRVIVVTDHGWLMLPDGLPKVELPQHLTLLRKGRCAVLKEGASTDQQTVHWHWCEDVIIAVATGIGCYEAGKEYEHGGISPQECVLPIITVSRPESTTARVTISDVSWLGLRCRFRIDGVTDDMIADIRMKAGDESTSLTGTPKTPNTDGTVSLLVPDEDRDGQAALIVVVSGEGMVRAQVQTIIGE